MSQKSNNPKFKGKCFFSLVEKQQFAVPSGSIVILSLQTIGELDKFLRICCSLINCFFVNYHGFFKSTASIYSWKIFYVGSHDKAGIHEKLEDVSSTKTQNWNRDFENQCWHWLQIFYECVKRAVYKTVGYTFTAFCNYVITTLILTINMEFNFGLRYFWTHCEEIVKFEVLTVVCSSEMLVPT